MIQAVIQRYYILLRNTLYCIEGTGSKDLYSIRRASDANLVMIERNVLLHHLLSFSSSKKYPMFVTNIYDSSNNIFSSNAIYLVQTSEIAYYSIIKRVRNTQS
jgi:hypothetical protein